MFCYTITYKTTELTDVQQTVIDTFPKSSKPQHFIAKVHRLLYPCIFMEV